MAFAKEIDLMQLLRVPMLLMFTTHKSGAGLKYRHHSAEVINCSSLGRTDLDM